MRPYRERVSGVADVEIKVLGTGCAKCEELYRVAQAAVAEAGLDVALVTKVEDMDQILAHGVMMTPALVIDGEVRSTGRVPARERIVEWVTAAAG